MGEEYTTIVDFLQHQKPILEELAEFRRQREQASKQREEQTSKGFANFLQQVNDNYRQVNDARAEEYKTPLQDNTALDYNYTGNPTPINPHLARRAEQGAKGHAAWAKEHPVLDAWGNAVGAVPLAVAAAPFVVGAGETAAGTAVGQGITSGLGWLANAARATPAVTKALPYLNAGLTSAFGAHGISKSIEEGGVSPESALEIAPLLQVAKPIAEGTVTAAKTAYDNGTLWDAYTTFGGRFGNYGDNIFTNMYGTAARRLGLPDKARVPADAIRKIKGDVHIDNGVVDFTGNKSYFGNPQVNTTLDRGVVSHSKGAWDGANTYVIPTRNFLEQTQGSLKSIEPSDMFSNGARVTESPQNVTLISGDIESLNKAREAGMQTLSSPRLRRLYQEEEAKYLAEKAAFDKQYANASGMQRRLLKAPEGPKRKQWWPEYAKEVQRLQAQRGTPTLSDFRLLEEQTGLNSGTAPISEYQNAIRQLKAMQNANILDIMDGKIQPYVYPNGRVVDWGKNAMDKELELINRAKYNKVFYDPASYVESNWRQANGIN